ncbi:unnamed protein product [Brassicogethes aeneus]|uniref:DUF4371 domain-containing protein n=1 Tax=Brassicogethes aeneus TaxID=1431903 RepID=A0A9P0ASY7_BRAAE|nr:unnamed protein product [Brassicogethes aeneus]
MDRFVIRAGRGKTTSEAVPSSSQDKRQQADYVSESNKTSERENDNRKKIKVCENIQNESSYSVAEKNVAKPEIPRAFQRWKVEHPWIDVNEHARAICTICTEACKLIVHFTSFDIQSKETWVEKGFSTWKHGAERIKAHSRSSLHISCAELLFLKNRGKVNIAQQLSSSSHKQMMDHRTALRKIFSTLRILGKQGLALRGSENDENSNFMAILNARAEDVEELKSWLKRTGHKWLNHDSQNEILHMMATKIMEENVQEIKKAEFYSILLDETADISKTEQVSIYFRIVSPNFVASEFFMGFYSTINTKSETLFDIVKDVLIRFNIPLLKLRGQCYDGAANVSGKISGLQQRLLEEEPRALFVHCNAHNLNLAVQDGIEKVFEARKFIGEVKELINFVRDSPKRVAKFQQLQSAEEEEELNQMPGKVLNSQSREMVASLLHYFMAEKTNGGPLIPFEAVTERVAAALNISSSTVKRIKQSIDRNEPLETPGQSRPRLSLKTKNLDDNIKTEVRNIIYNMYNKSK